ncbi:hypothetical protein DS843_26860 [Roseomonas genomospecies 6]|uniref:Uncharacterized protein n=1 Tax=Roseomonas genomospecies 6 TaxID=214106 RepID=A0A9W7KP54_9PROT|nr:hypothetical protein DS843_26860 [Roseomonas genomospecies 6]
MHEAQHPLVRHNACSFFPCPVHGDGAGGRATLLMPVGHGEGRGRSENESPRSRGLNVIYRKRRRRASTFSPIGQHD